MTNLSAIISITIGCTLHHDMLHYNRLPIDVLTYDRLIINIPVRHHTRLDHNRLHRDRLHRRCNTTSSTRDCTLHSNLLYHDRLHYMRLLDHKASLSLTAP